FRCGSGRTWIGGSAALLAALTGCDGELAEPAEELAALSSSPSLEEREASFTAFESGQVRPLALAHGGQALFAVNTTDKRLEVFRPQGNKLQRCGSVPVGLEPVAVAPRSDREVWVVNHLSDSVSIVEVDLSRCAP